MQSLHQYEYRCGMIKNEWTMVMADNNAIDIYKPMAICSIGVRH